MQLVVYQAELPARPHCSSCTKQMVPLITLRLGVHWKWCLKVSTPCATANDILHLAVTCFMLLQNYDMLRD